MLSRKQRLKAFFRKHFVPVDTPAHSPSPSGSAGPSPPQTRSSSRPQTPRSHHPPSGVTVADRPITQPRAHRRRRRRRTASPVGLPLYSAEPQAQEMSIFKSQDMSASGLDLSLSRATTGEGSYVEESEQEEDGEGDGEGVVGAAGRDHTELDDEEDEHSFFARPSIDVSGDGQARRGSMLLLTPPQTMGRPRSASEPLGAGAGAGRRGRSGSGTAAGSAPRPGLSPYLSHSPGGGSSPFASRSGLIDVPVRPPSPPLSPTTPPSRPSYFSHRSSRSSPINTLAASSPPSMGRPRASTLQRLMGSSANSSSSSLAIRGVAGGGVGVGAGGQAGRSPYGSLGARASSSTMSVREQGISMPLPNSFVHSSFIFPKTGPTPQQVAFLSSRESLGAYGYGPGVAPPPPIPSSRVEGSANDASPPAFGYEPGQPAGLAAPVLPNGSGGSAGQARGRTRSGSAASAASLGGSPLARVVTLPPEEREADVRARVDSEATEVPERARAESAMDRRSVDLQGAHDGAPPCLPALDRDLGSLGLSLPPPSTSSPSPSPSPSPLPAFPSATPSIRAQRPPDIVTYAPTPTTSAAPSPRLSPGVGGLAFAPPSPALRMGGVESEVGTRLAASPGATRTGQPEEDEVKEGSRW